MLQNLSPPPVMAKNKSRTLNLMIAKFCIMNNALYCKDLGGVLLNCLVEEEEKQVMEDFHKGDYGGHLFWKTTTNKIWRVGYDSIGYSNDTIFQMFSAIICITVHTGLFNFISSGCCHHSFSLGPKVKAIKLRFEFNFGLICLSHVFQLISVLKLSQEFGFCLSKLLTP